MIYAPIRIDDEFVDLIASALATRVADRLGEVERGEDRYFDADAAGRYLGIPRKRIHDLTSADALVPDGYDGRKPLYRRSSLDAYVKGAK
ncbi:MAG: hypothetical protein WD399_07605 [Thermoleophilaceae bacterium]